MDEVLVVLILGAYLGLLIWLVVTWVRLVRQGARQLNTFMTRVPKPAAWEAPGNALTESKWGQRLGGLILLALGVGFVVWMWGKALGGEGYHLAAALLFPVCAVLGLGLILFPMDGGAQRWKYGTSKPRAWNEVPFPMKVATAFALLAGFGNLLALNVVTR